MNGEGKKAKLRGVKYGEKPNTWIFSKIQVEREKER